MTKTEEKLVVLAKVAEALNQAQVTWAIGASLLLFIKEKVSTFGDIDIMVAEEDAGRAADVLAGLGQRQPPRDSGRYKTRCFLEYVVDEVEIDIMAGFAIAKDGQMYDCGLQKEDVLEYTVLKGQTIPLQTLAQWKRYYALMGKEEKVKLLEG